MSGRVTVIAVALVAVAALCAATGWYLLWPLAITGCALLYLHVRHRVATRADQRDVSHCVKIR